MAVIYKATNTINNKAYIGYDSNWPNRKRVHEQRIYKEKKEYFHQAIAKYGVDKFQWEILLDDATLQDEIELIREHNTFWENGRGYNMTLGGEGKLGCKHSPETRKKLSESAKRRPLTPERIAILKKATDAKKGVPRTSEERAKISKAHMGKVVSEETKKRISENHTSKRPSGAFYQSGEYKEKMRVACSGKKRTPEQKERYRQAALNRSAEHKEKIRLAKLAKKETI